MFKKSLSLALALVVALGMFTVTAFAAQKYNVKLTLDKTHYDLGEEITVTVTYDSAAFKQLNDNWAIFAMFKAGAANNPDSIVPDTERSFATILNITSDTSAYFTYDAPAVDGNYEIRFFDNDASSNNHDHPESNANFITSVSFSVGRVATATLALDKTSYETGANITATVTGDTALLVKNNATLAVYKPGAAPGDFVKNSDINFGTTQTAISSTSGSVVLKAPDTVGSYEVRLYSTNTLNAETFITSATFTVVKASAWAQPEVQKAGEMGLIPESLQGADLTKPITRAEFAAVSVKVYEALSGVKAIPAVTNPFTDTKDVEVLKAYNVGITAGTSATTFDPNTILNREQAATMLTRVFKKVSMPGWTLATDGQFKLTYTKPALFADDAQISDWAKDSVYFMAANGIIKGMDNNIFAPKNTTSAQEASGYANATREQALAIAVRMVENLGGQTANFQ